MAVERAGDTELGLDAHNSSLHVIEGTGCLTATVSNRASSRIAVLRALSPGVAGLAVQRPVTTADTTVT